MHRWPSTRGRLAVVLIALVLVGSACGGSSVDTSLLHRSVPGVPRGSVVAFVGDSYTVGNGASGAAHRWSAIVGRQFGWVEKNFGIGGTGYAAPPPYASRISSLVSLRPAAVLVSGGFNDLARGVAEAQFRVAATATFAELRQELPKSRIFGVRPFYPAGSAPPAGWAAYANDVREAVLAVGGTYLDIGSPLSGRTGDMSSDGLHPNDVGYSRLALAVERAHNRSH